MVEDALVDLAEAEHRTIQRDRLISHRYVRGRRFDTYVDTLTDIACDRVVMDCWSFLQPEGRLRH